MTSKVKVIKVVYGDCLDVLKGLRSNSIDACVTDPPYHLTANKRGGTGEASLNLNSPAGRSRITTGFMGKKWDGGDVSFRPETWVEVYRVLKPGAHMPVFGGTRTYHRLVCAIEDAGFEIRDCLMWVFGSGFPKSHDVSKTIDKYLQAERNVISYAKAGQHVLGAKRRFETGYRPQLQDNSEFTITEPTTAAAKQWDGWGTALKPAVEPICLCRKPLIGTVAENVLKWGTGAINVDGCRIGTDLIKGTRDAGGQHGKYSPIGAGSYSHEGRWPANLILDGSDQVVAMFPKSTAGTGDRHNNVSLGSSGSGIFGKGARFVSRGYTDSGGSAARFFYHAKASTKERNGSKHPTVKPLALIRYLVRLITPPKGTCLDPFAGTGTTGEAAVLERRHAVLIEQDRKTVVDIRRRLHPYQRSSAQVLYL